MVVAGLLAAFPSPFSADRPAVWVEMQSEDRKACPVEGAGSRVEVGRDAL